MHGRGELSLGGGSRYFRALLDSLLDAVVIADERGIIWGYNRAAHRLFGHAPGDVFGRPIGLLIPLDYWRPEAAPEGRRRRIEGQRKDGSPYQCELDITGFVVESQRFHVGVARELPVSRPSAGGIAGEPFEDAV